MKKRRVLRNCVTVNRTAIAYWSSRLKALAVCWTGHLCSRRGSYANLIGLPLADSKHHKGDKLPRCLWEIFFFFFVVVVREEFDNVGLWQELQEDNIMSFTSTVEISDNLYMSINNKSKQCAVQSKQTVEVCLADTNVFQQRRRQLHYSSQFARYWTIFSFQFVLVVMQR